LTKPILTGLARIEYLEKCLSFPRFLVVVNYSLYAFASKICVLNAPRCRLHNYTHTHTHTHTHTLTHKHTHTHTPTHTSTHIHIHTHTHTHTRAPAKARLMQHT